MMFGKRLFCTTTYRVIADNAPFGKTDRLRIDCDSVIYIASGFFTVIATKKLQRPKFFFATFKIQLTEPAVESSLKPVRKHFFDLNDLRHYRRTKRLAIDQFDILMHGFRSDSIESLYIEKIGLLVSQFILL